VHAKTQINTQRRVGNTTTVNKRLMTIYINNIIIFIARKVITGVLRLKRAYKAAISAQM